MTTPPQRPVHVACLLCDPAEVFFTFYHLTSHYYQVHPLVMNPNLCSCGHDKDAHNQAPTKTYCLASGRSPCPCMRYQPQGGAV